MSVDIRRRIEEVLETGYLVSLGFADDGGVWVCDVGYVFDEKLHIYWISNPVVRHSQAVADGTQVAGAITVSVLGEKNLGIQFTGHAHKIDEPRHDLALKRATKWNKPAPLENDDFLKGSSWYELVPERIELIDEVNFGYEKQKYSVEG